MYGSPISFALTALERLGPARVDTLAFSEETLDERWGGSIISTLGERSTFTEITDGLRRGGDRGSRGVG